MNINEIFGLNIKHYRISKSISQEKLANMSEIDRTYLPSIEKGKRKVSLEIAKRICDALGITLEDSISDFKRNSL